jgi:hypothetical protein
MFQPRCALPPPPPARRSRLHYLQTDGIDTVLHGRGCPWPGYSLNEKKHKSTSWPRLSRSALDSFTLQRPPALRTVDFFLRSQIAQSKETDPNPIVQLRDRRSCLFLSSTQFGATTNSYPQPALTRSPARSLPSRKSQHFLYLFKAARSILLIRIQAEFSGFVHIAAALTDKALVIQLFLLHTFHNWPDKHLILRPSPQPVPGTVTKATPGVPDICRV